MADYFTRFSCLLPVGPGNAKAALALYEQMQAELDADGMEAGFAAAAYGSDNDSLWLWDGDGAGDVESLIAFAIKCAAAFNLQGLWAFRWALTCSRARLDGFGGGAQLIDLGGRRSLSWVDTQHWIEEETARRREPTNSAADAFNPVADAQGWTATTQADLLLSFVGQEIAADPAVAARFRSFLAAVSAQPDEMLCRECGEPVFVTDAGDSHHVGPGMDGIDHAWDLAETSETAQIALRFRWRSICAGSAAKCGAFARCSCDHTALPEKEA